MGAPADGERGDALFDESTLPSGPIGAKDDTEVKSDAGTAAKDLSVFDVFDTYLATRDVTDTRPWAQGLYQPDLDSLAELLRLAIGTGTGLTQQSGRAAGSLDAWIAHELRRSGFHADEVWPRLSNPRALPAGLAPLVRKVTEIRELLTSTEASGTWGGNLKPTKPNAQLTPIALRRAIMALRDLIPGGSMKESRVLGQFYTKQVDVLVSSWQHGPEVIVSSKTMFSSYNNNRNNRYEETLGEATNLRGRYPLAAMGYAFLLRSDIHSATDPNDTDFRRMRDLVSRLRAPDGPYDATMLLVGDWNPDTRVVHTVGPDPAAPTLTPERFFGDLIDAVLRRTPFEEHQEIRRRRGDL